MGNQNKGPTKDKESLPQRPIVNKTGAGHGHPSNAQSTNSNSSLAPSVSQPKLEPKVEKAKCKFNAKIYSQIAIFNIQICSQFSSCRRLNFTA